MKLISSSQFHIGDSDQRLLASTLAYKIYNVMIENVRSYKETTSDDGLISQQSTSQFQESTIALYRYGGFALHSLLKSASHSKFVKEIILKLCMEKEAWDTLPEPVQYLQQGGLTMIKPDLLPFVRKLVEKVTALTNDTKQREHGKRMIENAIREIENDSELFSSFQLCVTQIRSLIRKT